MLALLVTGLALQISEIPLTDQWLGQGVLAAGAKELIFNPLKWIKENDLDLIVSASKSSIVMVEAGANEVEEAKSLKL